jgi:two-component system, OmpR family, sensor histidine kinase ArlS
MKLRNKINFSTAFLFIGLSIVMNISIYFVFSYLILDSEIEQARAEAERTVEGINKSLGTIPADQLLRAYVPIDGMIEIITSDKNIFLR